MEALLLALKLGGELVVPQYPPAQINSAYAVLVCGCECLAPDSAVYQCKAGEAGAREKRIEERNAKVREYEQIVKMCLPAKK